MATIIGSLLGGSGLKGAADLVNAIKGKSPEDAAKLAQINADLQELQMKYKGDFDAHQAAMEQLREQDDAAAMHDQAEIDKIEAGATGVGFWGQVLAAFKSCWRPAIGWVCAVGFFQQFIVCPWGTFLAELAGKKIVFPSLDIQTLMTMLASLLGLGAYRTYDKRNGSSK